jgi:hypothetical protein
LVWCGGAKEAGAKVTKEADADQITVTSLLKDGYQVVGGEKSTEGFIAFLVNSTKNSLYVCHLKAPTNGKTLQTDGCIEVKEKE